MLLIIIFTSKRTNKLVHEKYQLLAWLILSNFRAISIDFVAPRELN